MRTGATLFQGFDGVGIGMKAAGIVPLWGIEWRDDVAQVARNNGFHAITADLLTVDPHDMERVDYLHASPPCTNASVANANAGESEQDKALAYKTAQFVEVLKPGTFTLENVWQYRNFESFKLILATLERLGYWIDVQHVNSADFGVPQTRRRMILRARLGGWIPHLPYPVKWVGWYEAIEDLIQTLPESKFAPWQLERLPEEYQTMLDDINARSVLINTMDAIRDSTVLEVDSPSFTIRSNAMRRPITTPMALLVNTREMHGNDGAGYTAVGENVPVYTVASISDPSRHKAFLVGDQQASGEENRSPSIRMDCEPSSTIRAGNGGGALPRAFIVPGGNANNFSVRDASEPIRAQGDVNRVGNISRAYANGCVVSMTPRALARFQSFPDWYELPEKKSLACYGIGNAVPPLMMERIYEQLEGK